MQTEVQAKLDAEPVEEGAEHADPQQTVRTGCS